MVRKAAGAVSLGGAAARGVAVDGGAEVGGAVGRGAAVDGGAAVGGVAADAQVGATVMTLIAAPAAAKAESRGDVIPWRKQQWSFWSTTAAECNAMLVPIWSPPMPAKPPLLSYHDSQFVDSEQARPLRILSEYLAPMRAFREQHVRNTVVFFGSARATEEGPLGRYIADARELSRLVTEWSQSLPDHGQRLVVCSGGGPGIMQAANQGAALAGGRSVGLNIGLPHEQKPNPYITPELSFQFHYFFMRKLWFAHLARAIVIFPGGFGTLDEFFEILTLSQTRKLDREIVIVLYGSAYWKEIINFEALVRHGVIEEADLRLFSFVDDPQAALGLLRSRISIDTTAEGDLPDFANSVHPMA